MAAITRALTGSAPARTPKTLHFDIRPESDYVTFRGRVGETPPATIRGSVYLMTSDTLTFKGRGLYVELRGRRKTSHLFLTEEEKRKGPPTQNSYIINDCIFLTKSVTLTTPAGEHVRELPAGNHEFPFEIEVDGDTPETVEGLFASFITYQLHARGERPIMAKNLKTKRNIRLIRTLEVGNAENLGLIEPQIVQGTWPDKIKYSIHSPSRAVVYGDKLETEFELTPLLEKLKIGKITFSIKEIRKIKTEPGPEYSKGAWSGMWKEEQELFREEMELPPGSETTDETLQIPMYKFKKQWQLPRSLNKCRQSVEDGDWMRIKHWVYYDILLHNPDGHVSELKAHHNVRLFISDRLPIGMSNRVESEAYLGPSSLTNQLQENPPEYGSHQLDRLFGEVETNGYTTPGFRSGSSSPMQSTSRSVSFENLAIHGDAHGDHAQALQSRLENLQEGVVSQFQSSSPGASRNDSVAGYFSGYRHVDRASYDMESLERIASYDTATRTPLRQSYSEPPPTYETATSQPPSPGLTPPTHAHLRGGDAMYAPPSRQTSVFEA